MESETLNTDIIEELSRLQFDLTQIFREIDLIEDETLPDFEAHLKNFEAYVNNLETRCSHFTNKRPNPKEAIDNIRNQFTSFFFAQEGGEVDESQNEKMMILPIPKFDPREEGRRDEEKNEENQDYVREKEEEEVVSQPLNEESMTISSISLPRTKQEEEERKSEKEIDKEEEDDMDIL